MTDYDSFPRCNASTLYSTLHDTAIHFVQSSALDSSKTTRIDEPRIRAVRSSSNFSHSWGHSYAASLSPVLSETLDVEGFINHLKVMTPKLESWDADVTDVMVDEARMKVVVRASYWMQPKGVGKEARVENDIVWFLDLVEEEGGVKVKKSVEFVDGVAAGRLRELMMGVNS
jgi:hypothetical protein